MKEYSKQNIEAIISGTSIIKLEKKLGLRKGFFARLLKEDDWSFVIKLHALIEAACTDLILHRFDEPGLKNIISRLELSNKITGKMAIIKELELLIDEHRRFVASLSEWRNSFVHNVQNCNASFTKIVGSMDSQALKKFAHDFSPHENFINRIGKSGPKPLFDELTMQSASPDILIKRAKANPKFHIWLGACYLLADIMEKYSHNEYIHYDRAMRVTGLYDEDNNQFPEE